ncbi:MAG: hypothetical protein PHW62_00715 [Candidatus Ratteibacteria bacterium]|nr:hypothetical protein [Candidatus Ratteibacteria bacterium]
MPEILKTGTKVRLKPSFHGYKFHKNAGIGTVQGRWGKTGYTVNFGTHQMAGGDIIPYDVIVQPDDVVVISKAPWGFKHPHSPNIAKVNGFIRELHGSGINSGWSVEETKSSWRASNSFHAMDEGGFYDDYADFTVIFPKNESMGEFKLEFNGQDAQRLNQKHMLREYLEDTIAYTLDRLKLR